MKCLVVISHPMSKSLCTHLGTHVAKTLEAMGHEVYIENLYETNFIPTLSHKERESYYSGSYNFCEVSEQVFRLKQAEALVLVFPTWWFSFPAMLKGWFDRVWGPGIAYDHADDLGPIRPRLDNLKNVLVVTTLGAPWWVDRLVLWQPVRRVVKYALLGACARNSRLSFLSLYKSEDVDNLRVEKFMQRINNVLSRWK